MIIKAPLTDLCVSPLITPQYSAVLPGHRGHIPELFRNLASHPAYNSPAEGMGMINPFNDAVKSHFVTWQTEVPLQRVAFSIGAGLQTCPKRTQADSCKNRDPS